MKKIGILSVFMVLIFVALSATGTKTYIYKPANNRAELKEIYIDTDGTLKGTNKSNVSYLFWAANQTFTTITALDSTPTVQNLMYLTLPSAANTYITDFDDGETGQQIYVRGSNTAATIEIGTNILGWSGNISTDTNTVLGFFYDGHEWMLNSYYIANAANYTAFTADVGLTLTASSLNLDLASASARGGAKVGLGLAMTGDSIGIAFTAGTGLTLTDDDIALDLASASARGGAKIGYGLTMTGDSVGLAISTSRVLFTAGDPTPTVAGGSWFCTSPSSGTIITGFDNGIDGQVIYVMSSNTSNTFDFTTSNLIGSSADIPVDTNDILTFIYSSATTKWLLQSFIDASTDKSTGF